MCRAEVILTGHLRDKIHSSSFSSVSILSCKLFQICIVVYLRPWAAPWCYWGQCSVIYVSYWTRAGPKSGKLPRFWILGLQRDRGGQQGGSSGPARLSEWWDVNMGITATDTHYTSSGQLDQAWLGTILFFLALIGCGFVEYSSCKVYTHLKNEIRYD